MRRPTAGFTMVEVLVAVLLLAVGLVGALAMQAHAMRTRQESALQSEALQAAASLADRIRANAAQSSSYLGFEFEAGAAPQSTPSSPESPAACIDAPCGADALAQRELEEFSRQLQASLPAGRAVICHDSGAGPGGQLQWACSNSADAPLTIKIGWRGVDADANATPRLALRVALPGGSP